MTYHYVLYSGAKFFHIIEFDIINLRRSGTASVIISNSQDSGDRKDVLDPSVLFLCQMEYKILHVFVAKLKNSAF